MNEFITIYKVPITLYWDSQRALTRNTAQSGSWRNTGRHRVVNKVTQGGMTVYAINDNSDSYAIGWVRADDLGNIGQQETERVTYKVVAGDSLWKISIKFGVTVNDLRAWNGIVGDLIHPDQTLIVRQGSKEIVEEVGNEIVVVEKTAMTMEINGKTINLVDGINTNLFELPIGVTEVKLKGKGNVKFRYRPEVMG